MIQRITHTRFPVLVYQPPKVFDLHYAKACYQAGALPIVDTEFGTFDEVSSHLEQLAEEDIRFGLRLSVRNQALISYVNARAAANLDVLIFAYDQLEDLNGFQFDNPDCRFLIEALDIRLDDTIARLAPHGIVVKGFEAPGRVSKYSSFIMMQWYLENTNLPVGVHGGVGMYSAAGMLAAGASALVLDNQLYLAREAPVASCFQDILRSLDEKDTTLVGIALGTPRRFFAKLGTKVMGTLKEKEITLVNVSDGAQQLYDDIETSFTDLSQSDPAPGQALFYLGQDAIFARHFAEYGPGLADMINRLFEQIRGQLQDIDGHNPLRENSLLAREHGTRYPIVQGPMANVSDNAQFAKAVYDGGGLPFMAMGSLPEDLADRMLAECAQTLDRFGAGMIGIETVNEYLDAHIASVKKHRAPFALFAGGTPARVKALESAGTRTYLHTPAMSILDNAMQAGLNRFVFEGSEAGGHVGTLSSLVLWELAVAKMYGLSDEDIKTKRLVFAGGIGTQRAAHFIAGMTAGLAARGAGIGLQVGTAYLFAREIVETGAIKKRYQEVICKCSDTIIVGQTVGLSCRTVKTPFSKRMIENEHRLLRNGVSLTKRKSAFEHENIGSLLIGAKGFCPDFGKSGEVCMLDFDEDAQYEKGNYMVGDALAFYPTTATIADIHAIFFETEDVLTRTLNALEVFSNPTAEINDEIAVIGMGCVYPDADSPETLWQNVLAKQYSIVEMPTERLDPSLYFDDDRKATDKTYTRIGGIVKDYHFDGARYGYTEEKAARISRSQQMILDSAYQAAGDAGCLDKDLRLRPELRQRTAVIVGNCPGNELVNDFHFKYWFPELHYHLDQIDAFKALTEDEKQTVLDGLKSGMAKGVDYEPVHGLLLNIEASRIAHHMGIAGVNYVVDAACASSFAALDCAVRELLSGEYDTVIAGGVNTHLTPEYFVGFAKMGALSANGSYPFDDRADGFVLGEGAGALVLKRLKDAIRDGDRIYGVIKAVGSSSDGKGKAIAAPNPRGQVLALNRCYEKAKTPLEPADIGYIEAHGTSTVVGDTAEIKALSAVYQGETPIGISSIKSQIGHLLGGAGFAGLIKALLAIRHRTLPPNGRFETPASQHNLGQNPLFIIEDAATWETAPSIPRRAAVSSYGFGGINYHAVVEEYLAEYQPVPRRLFPQSAHDADDDRIVFAGLGVVLPGSKDVDSFWQNVVRGGSMLSEMPADRFHNDYYDRQNADSNYHIPPVKAGVVQDFDFNNGRFRIPPATVRSIDRAQLMALEAARQAVESADLTSQLTFGNRAGVILGTLPGTRQAENVLRVRLGYVERLIRNVAGLDETIKTNLARGLSERVRAVIAANTEDTVPGYLSNIVAGRIANFFGCNGANFVVDAACASAAVATRLAVQALRNKDLDFVITGGADANLYPTSLLAFKRMGLLSDDECRFFDNQAKGYVMAEGAAIQIMTTYGQAKALGMPILGEFKGMAMKSSASDHLITPSERGYAETIETCYQGLPHTPNQLAHLDVFGVSNVMLDKVEKQAVESSFNTAVPFGNIKSEFGYFKGANPAVVLTKLVLMAQHRKLLPNHSYSADSSLVETESVLKPNTHLADLSHRQTLLLGANLNGVGGNHGHVVVGSLPAWLATDSATAAQAPEIPEVMEFITQTAFQPPINGAMVLLSGQGSQYPGMMQEAYNSMPDIREMLDQGNRIFLEMRGYSLLDIMFGSDPALNQTENTQPAIFLSTAAIFNHFNQLGFTPDYFIGHSVGEYSALYCSGMLAFDDAMQLVVKRADFMKAAIQMHPGAIMVVFKDPDESHALIRESGIADLWVANKNSEGQTAVSGTQTAIDRFCDWFKSRNHMVKKLPLSGAFHTPLFASAAEKMAAYLEPIVFNDVDFGRVISNVTAQPYPANANGVKTLLTRQIISPVEFIASVKRAHAAGFRQFYEIGLGRILSNLLKNISVDGIHVEAAIHPKSGEVASLDNLRHELHSKGLIQAQIGQMDEPLTDLPATANHAKALSEPIPFKASEDKDFEDFLSQNDTQLTKMLYEEYQRRKREQALVTLEQFDFYTGKLVIAGTAIGIPGTANRVFGDDNFDRILNGNNCIEPLDETEKQKIVDLNLTRIFKQPDGNAQFKEITNTGDVIQLAGQLGYFDLKTEYGVDFDYDITVSLAMAAGIEALKDAHIPLVRRHRTSSTGSLIPDGYALPEELQETTGVIMTSLFPGFETLAQQFEKYYYNKFYVQPYEELENIYYHLMGSLQDTGVKAQVTDWFFKIKERRKKYGEFKFDRHLLFNLIPLGSAHLAQLIKAKGPNMVMSGACAATTQALGVAEDWIRTGRCERVIVIGGEAPTTKAQNRWIGSGFLALGAASVKGLVAEAAKPFDEQRNGTILGSGAVSVIVEREDRIQGRGLCGQAEILGTYIGNSAFHATKIDVKHLSSDLARFIRNTEIRHGLDRQDYTRSMIFMSHETFTPARGGSASAEISALKKTFPQHYRNITVTNTKGYTGHTLGAALEDAIMVKALQKGKVPPIANLIRVPEEFADIKFASAASGDYTYGLHFSAGFGSHFAFLFIRKIRERQVRTNPDYTAWLTRISGLQNPEPKLINNTLCLETAVAAPVPIPRPVATDEIVKPQLQVVSTSTGPAAIDKPVTNSTGVITRIKTVIAEQTGYTVDMLEDDLDLEADLGIDTVKHVEIFAKIADAFNFDVPADLKLRELNTIARLADFVGQFAPVEISAQPEGGAQADNVLKAADNTDVIQGIKAVIAEQTGYTVDMLEEELDLEADLGIDTVKHVEIFAKIADAFNFDIPADLKLRELNTIERLAAFVATKTPEAVAVLEPVCELDTTAEATIPEDAAIRRFTVSAVPVPLPQSEEFSLAGKTMLIAALKDDDICAVLTRKLTALGVDPVVMTGIDFADSAAVATTLEKVLEEHGRVDGFIHLIPLEGALKGEGVDETRIRAAVKSFFWIVKALHDHLDRPGTLIAMPSDGSVVLPYLPGHQGTDPVFAGVAGMMKTVNKELPDTRVKAVDLDLNMGPAAFVDTFISELVQGDPRVETGYRDRIRYGLSLLESTPATTTAMVRDGDTLLVTGGAVGITFEILKTLASRFKLKLILLARSDLDALNPIYTESDVNEAFIMDKLKTDMTDATPVQIRNARDRIIRLRKARTNLAHLASMGAEVDYHAVDVIDARAVIDVVSQHEKIDGVLHGAGVEESQWLRKKTSDAFDRVFDTKVTGTRNLLSALDNKPWRYFMVFSSVTARFGNEGQIDYTGANDMIGKMLLAARERDPGKLVKIFDWTAWKGTGMAAQETVQKVLHKRGLTFLPVESGVDFFMHELNCPEPAEVMIAAQDTGFDADGLLPTASDTGSNSGLDQPFIDTLAAVEGDEHIYVRTLDLARDRFLFDHSREGIPIFLGATGLEAMAEAAATLAKTSQSLREVRDFSIPYGIKILKGRPKEIRIGVRPNGTGNSFACRITSQFRDAKGAIMGGSTLHYQGTLAFANGDLPRETATIPRFEPPAYTGDFQSLLYHPARLFMDGLFRTVEKILSFEPDRIVAQIRSDDDRSYFSDGTASRFLTDIAVVDGMFQTGGMLEVMTASEIVLPYGIGRMHFLKPIKKGEVYWCITQKTASDAKTQTYQLKLVEPDGTLCIEVADYRMVRVERIDREHQIMDLVMPWAKQRTAS